MNKFLLVATTAAALVATPAAAQQFTGPRAEARLGFDRTSLDLDATIDGEDFAGDGHDSGLLYGMEVGYDAQLAGGLVLGAYAGIEGSQAKECTAFYGNDKACLKLGRNLTLGARVGGAVSPTILLYAKGGYSNGQLRLTYRNEDDSTLDFSDHANRGGFHFGAGIEAAVAKSTYVRAEYVRTNYDDYDYSEGADRVTLDGHRDQAVLGFGLRF